MLNAEYWAAYFKAVFQTQLSAFVKAIETRLMPAFDQIESEAQQAAEAEWNRLGQIPSAEPGDLASLAEEATETGVGYYVSMQEVRQAMVNLAVVGLHHAFEQQVLFFHRREVLTRNEEYDARLISVCEFSRRLRVAGLDVERLKSWPTVEELRAVANTVKHGEGRSADEVRNLRPDLFVPPQFRDQDGAWPTSSLYMPLAGEDIFLSIGDLDMYHAALSRFWEEVAAGLRRKG